MKDKETGGKTGVSEFHVCMEKHTMFEEIPKGSETWLQSEIVFMFPR